MKTAKPRKGAITEPDFASAVQAAREQLAERDRYIAGYDALAGYYNMLVRARAEVIARRGDLDHSLTTRSQVAEKPHLPLLAAMLVELRRTAIEMNAFALARGVRAFDEETEEQATMRVLLERGFTAYSYARFVHPELPSAEIANTGGKDAAKEERKALSKFYTATLNQLSDDLASLRANGSAELVAIAWHESQVDRLAVVVRALQTESSR